MGLNVSDKALIGGKNDLKLNANLAEMLRCAEGFGYAYMNADMVIQSSNPQFLQIMGIPQTTVLLGMKLADVFDEDAQKHLEERTRIFEEKQRLLALAEK